MKAKSREDALTADDIECLWAIARRATIQDRLVRSRGRHLEKQGLIKLRPDAGLKATPLDIVENPKKLKIVELDAAQIPRSLSDVDAAAINTNFAMEAGLKPKTDAIAIEDPKGPYANIIAIRAADKDKPWVAKLVAAYHSPEVKQYIEGKYTGAVIAAW